MTDAIEVAIAEYRAELAAAAPLADAELDELADHLRDRIHHLRDAGRSIDAAVTEARVRLGEPRVLACECARVRSGFSARLSPARARSGAVLLVVVGLVRWRWFPRDWSADTVQLLALGDPSGLAA